MMRTPYELAAAPTSHSAADPAKFDVGCRSKSNLPNRTDSNAALLPYLTHQLGSAHEWSGVWNGHCSIHAPNLTDELSTAEERRLNQFLAPVADLPSAPDAKQEYEVNRSNLTQYRSDRGQK